MKFVRRDLGAAAEVNTGGAAPGMRREIIVVAVALLAMTAGLWFGIAWATELALPLISVETERKWFGSFAPDDVRAEHELTSKQTNQRDRAAAVLKRLTADPAVPKLSYRLFVVPGAEPNAFAFPGGAIGVTEGLLELVPEDVSLAFVLGHELGHFAQRDHLRGIGRHLGRQLAWALIFGGDGGDLLSGHLATLLDLRHSRGQESGADGFGLGLVHRIYGTTHGTERLFEWLAQRDRQPGWLSMLKTHPATADRLIQLRAAASQLAVPAAPKP